MEETSEIITKEQKIEPLIIRHNTTYLNAALDALVELNLTKRKTELLTRLNELSEGQRQFEQKEDKVKKSFFNFSNRKKGNKTSNFKDALAESPKTSEEALETSENSVLQHTVPEASDDIIRANKATKKIANQGRNMRLKSKISKWNFNTNGTLNLLILLYGVCLLVIAFAIAYSLIVYG